MLGYLQHLQQRGLKHNTFLTHISALSNCTDRVEGVPVGRHPLVALWVLGNRSLHPPTRTLVPKWDLSVVLAAIIEPPYEPLHHATLKDLTLKTLSLFLIATASARRVSELHALCTVPPFLIERPGSFTLTTNPAFLPKTAMEGVLSSDIELSAFHPAPQSELERGLRLMCPVRALRYYLQCTQPLRGINTVLFAHWEEDRAPRPVSTHWISSALSEAIHAAIACMGRANEIFSANPHSVRGIASLATSWAEIARGPASGICRAATWTTACVFARHYRLNLGDRSSFGTQVFEAATRSRPSKSQC